MTLIKFIKFTLAALAFIGLASFSYQTFAQSNPFANFSSETITCIKNVIGETRYNEIVNGAQFTDTDKQTLSNSGCFSTTTTISHPSTTTTTNTTSTGTATSTQTTIQPVDINPFGGLGDQQKKCLQDALGARYDALAGGASWTPEDQTIVQKTVCTYSSYTSEHEGDFINDQEREQYTREFQPDAEVENCVKNAIGEEEFNAIKASGQPSPDVMRKAESCFPEKKYHNEIRSDTDFKSFEKCFTLTLGAERVQQMKEGKSSFTQEEREKMYQCMGKDPHPVAPAPEHKMSASLEKCLRAAVGEERFNNISSGQGEPTREEHAAGNACFKTEYEDRTTLTPEDVLPPDPKQVPFIEESDKVKINSVTIDENNVTTITAETTAASPKEVVDFYIYSENPVQISGTVGANGKVKVTYDGKLDESTKHTSFALVRSAGEPVRSPAKEFTVAQAKAAELDETTQVAQTDTQTAATSQTVTPLNDRALLMRLIGIFLVSFGAATMIIALPIYLATRERRHAEVSAQ